MSVPQPSTSAAIAARYGELPLRFEANKGQSDQRVKFLSRGPGYDLFLTATGAVLTLRKPQPHSDTFKQPGPADGGPAKEKLSVLRLQMIGASPRAPVEGRDELPGKINYLIGNDQDHWHTNIPTYLKVHYTEIYPGVDLVYYGNRTELEYDFIVAPGGNLNAIKFQFQGADRISVDDSGDLRLEVDKSEVRLRKPVIYQLTEKGERREVKGAYVLKGNQIGFKVKSFDASKPLIIDPVLSYSTLVGSGGNEYAYGIAVDSSGSAYITGATNVSAFPTTPGAFQTTSNSGGAFVSKLNPTGTSLVYSTYLSGSSGATGTAIAVDSSGNAYVTGSTTSPDFPSVNAIRGSYNFLKSVNSGASWTGKNINSPQSVYALALDPQTPSTIYAGTNGGAGLYKSTDNGNNWVALNTGFTGGVSVLALTIDPITPSTIYALINSPTTGVIKSTNGGTSWALLTLPATGGVYSLAIDPVSPSTLYLSSNGGVFKTTNGGNSWAPANNGLITYAFTIAIDPTTPSTIYAGGGGIFKSTNGGANWSAVNTGLPATSTRHIAIDPVNPATIYAGTNNGVYKSTNGGANWSGVNTGLDDVAIPSLAINPLNSATVYAGSGNGKIFKTLDGGNSWVSCYATNPNITVHSIIIDPSATGTVYSGTSTFGGANGSEAFLTKLNNTGSALIYSTLLGGSSSDYGFGIAIDSTGNAYVTGITASSDFLTANPVQPALSGSTDAFIAKVDSSGSALLYSTYLGGNGNETAYGIAADASGNAYVTGSTTSANFPLANAFQSTLASFGGDAFATKFNTNGTLAYSTYLGGSGNDIGYGIAVDPAGSAHLTGSTTSSNFPTVAPLQLANGGFAGDAFVTKLNPLGSGLLYSTYLGGNDTDIGRGIAMDSAGNAYVTGFTRSANFPTVAGAIRTKSPFFRSIDKGENWSNDNYGLSSDIVTTLALNPQDPTTIYAGTRSGVYRSINGGGSWAAINSGLVRPYVTDIVVDPITPSTVYLSVFFTDFSNSAGVYKSTDGGNTWNAANNGLSNTNVQALAIDPATPSTLYAGVYGNGIFKSIDGGASWTIKASTTISFINTIAVNPQNPMIIYAGANSSNGGVFKSTDGGISWQSFNAGLTSRFVLTLELDPTTPSTIYAAVNGGLFKSENSGISWRSINTGVTSGFVNSIAVDPFTPSTLYVGATGGAGITGGVFKSTNGGDNWRRVMQGLEYQYVSSVLVNPVNPAIVYTGVNVYPPDNDAFIAKINSGGSILVYSTLLGGSPAPGDSSDTNDEAFAIAVDSAGNAYVAGQSRSPDFIITPDAYQPFNRGFSDAFVAKLSMSYIISGQVLDGSNAPVSGAIVTLNDGTSLSSIVTEGDGSYQFSHLSEGGNFTVSAAKPHFTMAPTSQTFNNLNSNQTLNFIATATAAPFFTISGQITNNGAGLKGVSVTLSGSQAQLTTSDADGNYSFTLAGGGNYTVTPTIPGFTFTPPSQTFNNLSADQTANFTATRQNLFVTNANNHGAGSLRQAMLDAAAIVGTDTIVFNIPGTGVQTINLLTALPVITDPVVIDAATQPGYAGAPLIELNGASAGSGAHGFSILAGGSTIRGFAINRVNNSGIALVGNGNNVIQSNYIGINATGTLARPNNTGITLSNSSNNLIGGTTAAARNVISGNSFHGISMNGTGNQISGNFIGTNAAGTAALSNGSSGIDVFNLVGSFSANNVIGGTAIGAGNLISGNQRGISMNSSGAVIQGNLIGTDVSGTLAVGNGAGIQTYAAGIIIGGTAPGARNVISGNTGDGLTIGGVGSRLEGNFIGTDITGTVALGNGGTGVVAGNGALIGGTTPEARNVISGNGGFGNISLGSNNSGPQVTVQGNYIGTDVTGNVALTNPGPYVYAGISISGSRNLIGGLVPGAQNIISGNSLVGINISESFGPGPVNNTVQGNIIGLNAAGTAALPNAFGGIRVSSSNNNLIGGDQSGAANRISFNGGPGVSVFSGTGNTVRGNSIFSNFNLGIDLSLAGITPNDLNDPDTGANNSQNFPLLSSVTSDSSTTTIQGTLNSTPNTTFRIDFYSNAACDPSGNGEGAQFMGNASVTTAANGNAVINATLPVALASGRAVTATATDPNGNTSEFSACDPSQAPGSVHFSSANYYALEDVGNLTITVVRTGGSKGTISVNYSSANGTAIAGSDYSAVSGSLLFADGETSKTFTIPVVNDGVTEPDETLRLALGGTTDLERIGAPATATVTLQDNSTPLYLIINPADPSSSIDVLEGDSGNKNAVVPVVLSAATGRTVTANFNASTGTASSGVDYNPVSGSLTFAPGVTEQTISFALIGDTLNENNETVVVLLSNPTNAIVMNNGSVRIINDDPLPGLSINDVSVTEGNSGTTTLSFTVSLSPVSGRTVRVNFATANGTATAGSDFVTTSGQLTFNAGETSKTISVTVNGDTITEVDETVFVDLTSPIAATITKLRGVGTITNDEAGSTTVQFSITNYSKSEGGGSTNITVTRAGDTSGSSSVDYRTGGNSFVACNVLTGAAVQNCDFIVSAGTLNFAAGETSKTFPVLIYDDAYLEGDETLSLTLTNPVGASLGSTNPATLTIMDNDTAGAPSPAPKTLIATLSSSQEVPPSGTSGKGGGIVQLDAAETTGKVGLVFSNLSGAQTDAHIHGPAAVGTNGPIVFPLPSGTVVDHSINPTTQHLSDLKAGLYYMNVHSSNFTGGEIRGQLLWNPLNEAEYFVRQHYYDFLGRQPDQGGLDYWTNELKFCGTDVECLRDRSVGVSNAFFYEDEYHQTASYVFLLYRAAYGNAQPFPNPDPANVMEAGKLPRYLSFVRDRAQVVGGSGLAASQLALANAFVQRPEFIAKYPLALATGTDFVNAVLATVQSASGVDLSSQSATLITHFNAGGRGLVMFHLANDYWNGCNRMPGSPAAPCVPAGSGAAVDNRPFIDAEYNRSFVYSQYSGYLRRDADIDGFIFWLNQVSTAPPRNVAKQRGMVCAFITSAEYQLRFGNQTPRTNGECIP